VENAAAQFSSDHLELSGSLTTFGSFSGRYGGLPMHFVASFSEPPERCELWRGRENLGTAWQAAGEQACLALYFPARSDQDRPIEVRVGLSAVSVAGARANLDAEMADRPFSEVLDRAKESWEQVLSRIQVEGGTPTQRRIFYTALYRAFQMPTVFSDVDGQYPGFDGNIHRADGFVYHTDFSLWDTFRTVMPLYYLIAPEESRDMLRSLLAMAEQGGGFPRWPSGRGYTGCMFGTPADMAVSEAWLKGLRDFDGERAYALLRRVATDGPPPGSRVPGRDGLAEYASLGWVPGDRYKGSVAKTLEYAWGDHALAGLAEALGHREDAAMFRNRAERCRSLWDPGKRFFLPRDSAGKFIDFPFDPLKLTYTDFKGEMTRAYVEGSAMQWRWAVPFDPEGLVALFSSPEAFARELEAYLAGMRPEKGWWHPGGNYWHGNEPYFHAPWLFIFAGRPDRTQYWVRHCLNTRYGDDPVGLDGNDDGGTLSAWYVWSALGIYPQAGSDRYWLGAPLFNRISVRLEKDRRLELIAENHSSQAVYVREILADGAPVQRWTMDHRTLTGLKTLRFVLSDTPGAGSPNGEPKP
ncbi:MAG TPA: GH92 family glycosyl hydrolase, partial [Candidatus Hydrogenedentes bacterium]|nr:GH92 family glycosyl hydrolase [Candidatus Hydrogenedentota bacterium]